VVYVFTEGRYVLELYLRAVAVEDAEEEGFRFIREGERDPAGEVVSVLAWELFVLLLVLVEAVEAVEVEEEEDAVDTFDWDRTEGFILVWFRCEEDRISITPSSSSSSGDPV